jgi:hypothetical protein
VSSRSRKLAFGSAAALVVIGAACAALVSGLLGEVLTIAFVGLGLAGGVLLLFLEVGLSEERDLAREERERGDRGRRALQLRKRSRLPRTPRRPD